MQKHHERHPYINFSMENTLIQNYHPIHSILSLDLNNNFQIPKANSNAACGNVLIEMIARLMLLISLVNVYNFGPKIFSINGSVHIKFFIL